MKWFATAACAAGMALSLAVPAVAAITNGGFEQQGGGTVFLTPGSTYITGWTVVDATPGGDNDVSVVNNASYGGLGVYSSEGNYFLDLTGNTGKGKGVVSNPVAVTAGTGYQLAFDVGAFWVAGFGSYGDATVDLLVNGVLAGSFTNTQSLKTPGSDWQRFTYDFIATGPSVALTFLSSTSPSSSYLGVGLDNVALEQVAGSAVPEPATWALMIAGFGLTGASLRRRRMVAA